ncbi:MAG: hypothetical protein J6X18_01130 [Bacteroidales bacterium]|nr:hypothetical protein [Bacteroidales bacterium]
MSAWTWTFVKADSIPTDMVSEICDSAIQDLSSVWYMDKRKTFEEILERWFEIHDKSYDYYVNECGLQPFEMEHGVLEKRLRENISKKTELISDLSLVKNGELSLDACLRKHEVWQEGGLGKPRCTLVDDVVWVKVPEIFRLQYYSDMSIEDGIKTVEDLLAYLSEQQPERIHDFQDSMILPSGCVSGDSYGLTDSLKKRIVEYYGRFGDGNFSVHFG